jgi:hypothetical protein
VKVQSHLPHTYRYFVLLSSKKSPKLDLNYSWQGMLGYRIYTYAYIGVYGTWNSVVGIAAP